MSTIVFTNGVFDILHQGHCELLSQAKALGDILVVGINTDESVKRIKGEGRPFIPLSQRMFVLRSLRFVDMVVPFHQDTPEELIHELRPSILVKGGDYSPNQITGADFVKSYGGRVITIPFSTHISTSAIIKRIDTNYI